MKFLVSIKVCQCTFPLSHDKTNKLTNIGFHHKNTNTFLVSYIFFCIYIYYLTRLRNNVEPYKSFIFLFCIFACIILPQISPAPSRISRNLFQFRSLHSPVTKYSKLPRNWQLFSFSCQKIVRHPSFVLIKQQLVFRFLSNARIENFRISEFLPCC